MPILDLGHVFNLPLLFEFLVSRLFNNFLTLDHY